MSGSEREGELEERNRDIPAENEPRLRNDDGGTRTTLSPREQAEAAAAVQAIFGDDGPPDFDDIAGPMYWPTVAAADGPESWTDLHRWVEQLIERFPHIDHHVIPLCWWRHNGHVEALVALRDHERMCYSDSSPSTAGVEWHRAFRDVEARLREWTSTLACGASHDPRLRPARVTDANELAEFVEADSQERAKSHPPPEDENDTSAEPGDTAADHEEPGR